MPSVFPIPMSYVDSVPTPAQMSGALCLALGLLLHSGIIGGAMMRIVRCRSCLRINPYLQAFFYTTVGLAADIAILFLLGISHLFDTTSILIAGIVEMILAVGGAAVISEQSSLPDAATVPSDRADALFVMAMLFAVLIPKAMSVPGHWDDTMYHLPLAKFYVEHYALAFDQFARYPLFPQNMEMLFSVGLMFDGTIGAQALAVLPVFLICIGIIGAGLWLANSFLTGAVAVAIFLFVPAVRDNLGSAHIDDGLALFSFGAILGLGMSLTDHPRRLHWLAVAGILAGVAAGCKLFGIGLVAILFGYLIIARRDWRAALAFTVPAALFGCWWYLRSFLISGDPISPAGGPLFGFFLWNAGDLEYQKSDQARFGVPKSSLNFIGAFAKERLLPLLPGILAIFTRAKNPGPITMFWAVYMAYSIVWFFTSQIDRYMAPVMACAALLSGVVIEAVISEVRRRLPSWRPPSHSWSARAFGLLLLPVAVYMSYSAMQRWKSWAEKLSERPGYTLFKAAEHEDAGNVLLQLGFENAVYFFNGQVIGDWFGPARYRGFSYCNPHMDAPPVPCRLMPPLQLIERMSAFHSRMIAINQHLFKEDVAVYLPYFRLAARSRDGILLVLK